MSVIKSSQKGEIWIQKEKEIKNKDSTESIDKKILKSEKTKEIWEDIFKNKNIENFWLKDGIKACLIGPQIIPSRHLNIYGFKKNEVIDFNLEPIDILTNKNGSEVTFRKVSFISKFHLIKFWDYFEKQEEYIVENFLNPYKDNRVNKKNYTDYSIFKDDRIEPYFFIELKSLLNPREIEKFERSERSWAKRKLEEFNVSVKYEKQLKIDVSNFYDSIYTHSFEWISKTPTDDAIMKEFDKLLMQNNGGMTKGITTGSIMSKISAEILMVKISTNIVTSLKKQNIKFHIYRFADDFTIYYNDDSDFEKIISIFKNVFNNFKLSINEQKFIKDNNNLKEINWSSTFENYEINISKSNQKKYKKNINLLKDKISELNEIVDIKKQLSYLKYFFKIHYTHDFFEKITSDENFSRLVCNFALKFVRLDDLNLNIPFTFLEDLITFFNKRNIHKIIKLRDDLRNKISEIFCEVKESLYEILEETNSEMKKIFIFDFLYINDENELYNKKFKQYYNIENNLKEKFLLHTSQLLEAKIINVDHQTIKKIIAKISFTHSRLSKEWIIVLYLNKMNNHKEKDKINSLINIKDKMKPFNY